MQALLTGFGVPDVVTEIDLVRQQLRLAESAGYIATGLPGPADPVYILKHDTSACLHASNTESIPPGAPTPANFEVYHQPLKDDNDPADLWALDQLGTGKSLTSKAFGRNLHASASQVTPQGHKYLYTCAPSNGQHAEEFTIAPVPVPVTDPANPPGRFAYTGYFNLSARGRRRWRSSGSTSLRAVGPGCIRSCPAPTSISTDHPRGDHRPRSRLGRRRSGVFGRRRGRTRRRPRASSTGGR